MTDIAVKFEHVSKVYRTYARPSDRLREMFYRGRRVYHNSVAALSDVSFTIERGTTFGILGRNGSGKSTALQIIANVLQPSAGNVTVNGRVSALLELGSGFDPEFSGIENVYLYASILGLSRDEIERKLDGILAFADIGDFVYQPVKTYSSGMTVRLAFAVAVAIDSDILLVDEALAVGDMLFQHKCILRMRRIMESGATVIFVSHDIATVKMLCRQAVLLEKGKVVAAGAADEVAREYHRRLFAEEVARNEAPAGSDFGAGTDLPVQQNPASTAVVARTAPRAIGPELVEQFQQRVRASRFGSGQASIIYCEVLDSRGQATTFIEYGERFVFRIYVRFHAPVASAVIGFIIRNSKGVDILSSNTHIEHTNVHGVQADELVSVDFELENVLRDDHYSLSTAVTGEEFFHQARPFDWVDNALILRTGKPKLTVVYGLFYPSDVGTLVWRRVGEAGQSIAVDGLPVTTEAGGRLSLGQEAP